METLYLISLIPLAIGGVLFFKNHNIHWVEWLIGTAAALFLSGMTHIITYHTLTGDTQVISGYVQSVEFHAEWVEEYKERHESTSTDSKGNTTTRVWYTTEHATHPESYYANLDYGRGRKACDSISFQKYKELKGLLGGTTKISGKQSPTHGGHYDRGDNNIYLTANTTGYIYPVIDHLNFKNKIKASKSMFSYVKIPKEINVFEYNLGGIYNPWRLYGTASKNFDKLTFDRLNTELGPKKKINLIMVGFDNPDEMIAKYQEAKWIGGKKNDFVICYYAPDPTKPAQWSYVFGWTDSVLAKRNVETIMLNHPVNDAILIPIREEIVKNYTIKNWDDFDYIQVQPPAKAIYWLICIMLITQIGLYIFFHKNDLGQNSNMRNRYGYEKNDWRF